MNTNTWNLDPAHSGIQFSIRHLISTVRGRFGRFRGTLQIADRDLTQAVVEATIEAESIDTGVRERDEHLRSADFFYADLFPEIRFRGRGIERVEDGRYRLSGELTIRGITRDVTLEVDYGGRAKDPWGNERIGFAARASIDRSDFGLTWNQVLELGGVLLGDRVDIMLEVQAVRAAAAQAA